MIRKKGQAAMEFLMTYGWAIIVVLIAIGALAAFGVLDIDFLIPERTIFPAPISQADSSAIINSGSNQIEVALRNGKGNRIMLTGNGWLVVDGDESSCTLTSDGSPATGLNVSNSEVFLLTWDCTDGGVAGDTFSGKLKFEWESAETGQIRNHTGEVTGKYS